MHSDNNDQMWTLSATCAFFGGDKPIHPATLYRGIAAGRYPKPVRIGPNTARWLSSECHFARQALIAARDGNTVPDTPDRAQPTIATGGGNGSRATSPHHQGA
jgi:predicted DNA-binding transcriptional regulator AlpA